MKYEEFIKCNTKDRANWNDAIVNCDDCAKCNAWIRETMPDACFEFETCEEVDKCYRAKVIEFARGCPEHCPGCFEWISENRLSKK